MTTPEPARSPTGCPGPGPRRSPVQAAIRAAVPADGSPITRRELMAVVRAVCPQAADGTISTAIHDMSLGCYGFLERTGYGVYRRSLR
jgi:hypothetical protein